MKTILQFRNAVLLLLCLTTLGIGNLYSQAEITVEEGLNTLYDAVVANPGATIKLKRGATYANDKPIAITVATIIKGETSPAETVPAVIQYFADPGQGVGKNLIDIGANFTIQDVGLSGFTFDDQQIGSLLNIISKDISVTMDGCVVQGADLVIGTNENGGLTIVQKNCKLFNLVKDGAFDNWGGFNSLWGGDNNSFKSVNNTFFTCGRVMNCAWIGPNATEWMEHNTYVNTWGDLFYPTYSNGFVVKNNIIYNSNLRGYVGPRTDPEAYDGDFTGDFSADTLQGDICITPTQSDSVGDARNIVVTNNLRFTSADVLAKQKEATATMHPFINKTVLGYFDTYKKWTLENNLTEGDGSVDPGFEMGEIPAEALQYHFKQLIQRRRASLQETGYPFALGYWPNGANKGSFIWPLPFNLKPTNATALSYGENGYPLGDLNWFGKEVVTAWENGEKYNPTAVTENKFENIGLRVYPNPANNLTQISYSLTKAGNVSLKMYNSAGAEVAILVDSHQQAGSHEAKFNTSALNRGIYLCKLQTSGIIKIQKVLVVR
jgi:hypothetical protein